MTVSKLTNPPSQKGVIDKINEVIDNLGGGGTSLSAGNGINISSLDAIDIVQEDSGYTWNDITIVGTPTLYDGVYSGFSASDYIYMNNYPTSVSSFEMQFDFITGTLDGTAQFLTYTKTEASWEDAPYIFINSENKAVCRFYNNGSSVAFYSISALSSNTEYVLKLVFNGLTASCTIETSGTIANMDDGYGNTSINVSTVDFNDSIKIGMPSWTGGVRLNNSYIKVNGSYYGITTTNPPAKATSSLYGLVKPDGTTITVNNGVLTSHAGQRNIGEIVPSIVPLTDAGFHLLDGALISGLGIYADFVTYISGLVSTYPDLFETEANWQQSVTTYGVCGKFVYDSVNNTVRLPKITGIVEGTTDFTALGDLVQAGLPNIAGSATTIIYDSNYPNSPSLSGSLYKTYATTVISSLSSSSSGGGFHDTGVAFDASRSSFIYGNSSTVQPQTIKVLYYIVIANSTKTDIQVDIDEIATDLNGKADVDLTNTTNQGKILMSGMGMPSSRYVGLTLGASGSQYTAPANGWYYLQKFYGGDNLFTRMSNITSGYSVNNTFHSSSDFFCDLLLPVKKGDVMAVDYNSSGSVATFKFIYAVGSESEAQ